ncbi:TIM barrel protein [Aliihoeflea sp. 2WW]|uniref:hydroxypyruvate isomerase family protein n=1 Tax=Aliihoeflea sp. 2WW TaxID=1381123 RepID=UPI000467B8C0|nr:TIM barrel protein [Aliihoeflea sp. 2WW]
MPRFSINVSMMLHEFAFLDRFQAAADLGFAGVDIQFPYDFPADALAKAARRAGVEIVLINVPAGDLTSGGDGLACVPGREKAFARAVEEAADYAFVLGVKRVNVLSGRVSEGVARDAAFATLVGNLQLAADRFAPLGVTVMAEPCNGRDVPRYLVQRTADAIDAIDAASRRNLAVQFDFYHRQIVEGDLIGGFRAALPRIAHVQFADTPGRHEPGTGEINHRSLFAAIDASGYSGWVGAEYRPTGTTAASLTWRDNL